MKQDMRKMTKLNELDKESGDSFTEEIKLVRKFYFSQNRNNKIRFESEINEMFKDEKKREEISEEIF